MQKYMATMLIAMAIGGVYRGIFGYPDYKKKKEESDREKEEAWGPNPSLKKKEGE